ncbi:MAG TPA: tripartite tricarboxylate transporter substrate binding protein, partial [Burkholderiales bacterium]|nr:tripartite tricarboxylate transporter substrate binding protein [Burkholderiales bacterium]
MTETRSARALVRRCAPLLLSADMTLASLFSAAAFAQNYPAQPVKVLLPYAAGGVADITARVIGQKLSQ